MLNEKEREALFILTRIPGMYRNRIMRMYEYAGSFADALSVSESEYRARGIFLRQKEPEVYENFRRDRAFLDDSRSRYHGLSDTGIRMIDFTESSMPERLSSIPDPPAAIFVRGALPDDKIPSASIIGSRNCSTYGSDAALYFGRELAKAGVQIVSGMAIGIDSFSLAGALEGGKKGFAVLGSGVDVCYPRSERPIYREMSLGMGGVISEFAPDAEPVGYHFILRNRLISAFGDVLLVIEAAERSGTAITVGNALEQGKDVFALPGRITDPLGRGCNKLLKDGAFPLTEPSDVLSYLGMDDSGAQKTMKEKDPACLSEEERAILRVMGPDGMHVEDIASLAGKDLGHTVHLLSSLELSGFVRSHGSAYYSKVYR